MEEITSYFAVYRDGSVAPIKSPSSAETLPHYEYILKERVFDRNSSRYNEFTFIDKEENVKNLRVGNWELVHVQSEDLFRKLNSGQQYKLSYKLYNHSTKTVFDFDRLRRGVKFFKEELFPKLHELENTAELLNQNIQLTLTQILLEISELKKITKSNDLPNNSNSIEMA